jgi:hypothetical protein
MVVNMIDIVPIQPVILVLYRAAVAVAAKGTLITAVVVTEISTLATLVLEAIKEHALKTITTVIGITCLIRLSILVSNTITVMFL